MIRPVIMLAAVAALAACTPAEPAADASASASDAAATAGDTAAVTPESVRAMIEADGAQAALGTLWNENEGAAWAVVEAGIYEGDQAWLDIFSLIQPGLDGAMAMGANVGMSKALLINPTGVLGAAPNAAEYCVNADADYMEMAEDAAASNAEYYPAAIAAVEGVTDPALAEQRTACLANLRAGQAAAAAR
jgi:hypothetical protein